MVCWREWRGSMRRAVVRLSLLPDYRAYYGIWYLSATVTSSGQRGRGAIHPHTSRATISAPFFFFLLWLSLTADMHMQLPDQYPGYVVRDLYCIPAYSHRLLQSLPSSSSQSRLRLQLFPPRFPHLLSRKYLLCYS